MTVVSPCYEHWHINMLADNPALWNHFREMERGIHGSFSQALFKAMEKADGTNSQKLYNTFFQEFNP